MWPTTLPARTKSPNAVQQLVVQNVANQAFPMLQYLDTVQSKRTGVSDASQGLDPSILQNLVRSVKDLSQSSNALSVHISFDIMCVNSNV